MREDAEMKPNPYEMTARELIAWLQKNGIYVPYMMSAERLRETYEIEIRKLLDEQDHKPNVNIIPQKGGESAHHSRMKDPNH